MIRLRLLWAAAARTGARLRVLAARAWMYSEAERELTEMTMSEQQRESRRQVYFTGSWGAMPIPLDVRQWRKRGADWTRNGPTRTLPDHERRTEALGLRAGRRRPVEQESPRRGAESSATP